MFRTTFTVLALLIAAPLDAQHVNQQRLQQGPLQFQISVARTQICQGTTSITLHGELKNTTNKRVAIDAGWMWYQGGVKGPSSDYPADSTHGELTDPIFRHASSNWVKHPWRDADGIYRPELVVLHPGESFSGSYELEISDRPSGTYNLSVSYANPWIKKHPNAYVYKKAVKSNEVIFEIVSCPGFPPFQFEIIKSPSKVCLHTETMEVQGRITNVSDKPWLLDRHGLTYGVSFTAPPVTKQSRGSTRTETTENVVHSSSPDDLGEYLSLNPGEAYTASGTFHPKLQKLGLYRLKLVYGQFRKTSAPTGDVFVGRIASSEVPIEVVECSTESELATEAQPHVNQQRLWGTLEKLSEFGRSPSEEGKPKGFEGGVTRLGFSNEDLAAREYVTGLMRDAGLTVRVDPAGNIFGRRPSHDVASGRAQAEKLPALLFGSHIDSVPNGGNFDGDVGSMGAIEVMRALNDAKVRTRHPLEVVIWTNEEGHHFRKSLFGSTTAAGLMEPEVLKRTDDTGATVADWLRRYGQDPAKLQDARIPKGRYAAYIELHIEQGGTLDQRQIEIGVVEGIVGIQWRTCRARGFANHAGTTPMPGRRDAFLAAAQAALAVREEVRREGGREVGTVGYVKVEPNAGNIIPGMVEFIVELRDLDASKYERTWARIEKRFAEIAAAEEVAINCELVADERPALTTPAIRDTIREAARVAGFSTLDLPSGAGHDAQQVSHFAPIGMIFVPSRDGISHSPREYSTPDAVARGAETLYRTLLLLDTRLDPQ